MDEVLPIDASKLQNAFISLSDAVPYPLKWITVVTADGLLVGSFPKQADEELIAAYTASLDAQSERLSSTFGNGPNRYTIITGRDGLYLVLIIPGRYFMALNFASVASFDTLLGVLQKALEPLLTVLGIV